MRTVTGLVIGTQRHGATVWGNPMMSVTLSTPTAPETFRISNDSGLVYGIDNPEYRNEPHVFSLTRAGRISGVIGRY